MRMRKLLVALAGLAVVVAAGVVALWPQPLRATWENYDSIREGMTRAEVVAILGPPETTPAAR
jgi:outer membrane protein assembly factor BamE (lipoprotein component of BamABCDE complex)